MTHWALAAYLFDERRDAVFLAETVRCLALRPMKYQYEIKNNVRTLVNLVYPHLIGRDVVPQNSRVGRGNHTEHPEHVYSFIYHLIHLQYEILDKFEWCSPLYVR